jgi:hypothetical protein
MVEVAKCDIQLEEKSGGTALYIKTISERRSK